MSPAMLVAAALLAVLVFVWAATASKVPKDGGR